MNNYHNDDLPDWLKDEESDDAAGEPQIEEPTDGPPPDWMRVAASGSSSPLTEDNTPDWLKSVRAGRKVSPEEANMKENEAEPAPAASQNMSDGLSDLERLLAEEGIDLNTVNEERPQGAEGMTARDWLIASSDDEMIRNRIGSEPIAAEPKPAPQPEPPTPISESSISADKMIVEEDLPEWLQEVSIDEDLAMAEAEPAGFDFAGDEEWTPEPVTDAITDEEDKMIVEEGLPDWLRDMSDESPEEESAVAEPDFTGVSASTAPTMSDAITSSHSGRDKMVVEEDLPDWLQEVSDEVSEAFIPADRAEVPVASLPISDSERMDDEDLPDWLKEEPEEEGPAEEVEPIILSRPVDTMILENDLPDWLREVEEESVDLAEVSDEVEQEPAFSVASADEDLPGWLREVEETSTESESFMLDFEETAEVSIREETSAALFDEEDLPDWLRDVQEGELEEPAPVSAADKARVMPTAVQDDLPVDEEALPDWLKEVQEGEAEAESLLPDWLEEIPEEELVQPLAELEESAEVAGGLEDIVDEEGLPDWLQEVSEEEAFEPSEPSPEPFEEMLAEEDEELLIAAEDLVIEEELPDWLQEAQEETPEAIEETLEPTLTPEPVIAQAVPESIGAFKQEEELPDWLKGLEEEMEAEARPLVEEAPEPAPVAAESHEAEVEEIPEQAEAVEEEAVLAGPVPAPVTVTPVVPTTPGGLPDWLKKLREGETGEMEPVVTAVQPRARSVSTTPSIAAGIARPQPVPAMVETETEDQDLPDDAEERLKLARAARDEGNIDEAVRIYDSLVTSGAYLDRIIEDVQLALRSYPSNYLLFQLMGDAMMKDGRLKSALDAYREALARL